ncbi:serine O-acetyltransferase EpsC [Clostridium sp. DL1XJH146]
MRIAALDLNELLETALMNFCKDKENHIEGCTKCRDKANDTVIKVLDSLPDIREILHTDIEAAYNGDPAAISKEEILLSYPSVEAISIHRLAHLLYQLEIPLIPRLMSEIAHQNTGIDIHPGAKIEESFFIDHGTGVVIGETCTIGKNVKIYQGVTLGAKSFPLDKDGNPIKGIKRHPDIGDNVVIYAGATILGGDTVIGNNSTIGGNVWLTHSVPQNSTVYTSQPSPIIK